MRKTKIVCTIGPACESPEMLRKLIDTGMNVARLNFSHGSYEEHATRIQRIREASEQAGKAVGIMLDIKGPKIRTGMIENDQTELVDGHRITLTTEECLGTKNRVSISYEGLPDDVSPGSRLLIDDGLIGLVVEEIRGTDIHCQVVNGGTLKNRKGINAPGVRLRIPSVTEKDIADIRFGIEQGVDMIAASFVRKASDVLDVRRILEEGNVHMDIIAKIEAEEALDQLDAILEVADGLMVARGDLGVEIPTEEVPLVQKRMIEKCNIVGKPVITATQMLDSMQRNPRPTRAEASDVANAIFDGTDAIMLSGETAAGRYPNESVAMMARIAERTEEEIQNGLTFARAVRESSCTSVTESISHAVSKVASELRAKAIITSTHSGYTARMVSKYRPTAPIVASTPSDAVARRLMVSYGVYPVVVQETTNTDEMLETAISGALHTQIVSHGDLVVITGGVPVGIPGTTNLIKVHTIGDILAKGQGIGRKSASGRVVSGIRAQEIRDHFKPGDIIVTPSTDRDIMDLIEQASAVITESGGITSHAAVVCVSLGIPVVVGVQRATDLLNTGQIITVDTERGLIYKGRAHVL